LRLGRLPGLSAFKTSESISTINIGLYAFLLARLSFSKLLCVDSVISFMTVGRPGVCGASGRSTVAEVEGPARGS
jgi:hypothetical protein